MLIKVWHKRCWKFTPENLRIASPHLPTSSQWQSTSFSVCKQVVKQNLVRRVSCLKEEAQAWKKHPFLATFTHSIEVWKCLQPLHIPLSCNMNQRSMEQFLCQRQSHCRVSLAAASSKYGGTEAESLCRLYDRFVIFLKYYLLGNRLQSVLLCVS